MSRTKKSHYQHALNKPAFDFPIVFQADSAVKTVVIRQFLSSHQELSDCIETFKPPETLQPHEVEVDVRAIAVNFAVRKRPLLPSEISHPPSPRETSHVRFIRKHPRSPREISYVRYILKHPFEKHHMSHVYSNIRVSP